MADHIRTASLASLHQAVETPPCRRWRLSGSCVAGSLKVIREGTTGTESDPSKGKHVSVVEENWCAVADSVAEYKQVDHTLVC